MTDGVSNWNNKVFFPTDRYTLHCVEEKFAPSNKGNPMITREFEIVSPAEIQIGDRKYNIAGLKIVQYRTVKVKDENGDWDTVKSDKSWGNFRDELLAIGFDPEAEVDDENPPLEFKGKNIDAILYAREDVARKSVTPEQAAKGIRQGDPITDANDNEIKTYQIQLQSIQGLAS